VKFWKSLPLAVALVVVTVAHILWIELPLARGNRRLSAELAARRAELGAAPAQRRALLQAQARRDATVAYNRKWTKKLSPAHAGAATFGDIAAAAAECGVELTEFTPSPVVRHQRVSWRAARIGCRGSFTGLAQFLELVEQGASLIWARNVKLGAEANGADLELSADLVVFSENSEDSDGEVLAGSR
jgi:hypothetical protein